MEKKNLIMILSALIVVLGIGIIYLFFFRGTELVPIQPEKVGDCSAIKGSYIKDSCYMQIAAKEANVDICNNILNANQKDLCFIELSKIKNDNTLCELIVDKKYSRTKCYGELTIL